MIGWQAAPPFLPGRFRIGWDDMCSGESLWASIETAKAGAASPGETQKIPRIRATVSDSASRRTGLEPNHSIARKESIRSTLFHAIPGWA